MCLGRSAIDYNFKKLATMLLQYGWPDEDPISVSLSVLVLACLVLF